MRNSVISLSLLFILAVVVVVPPLHAKDGTIFGRVWQRSTSTGLANVVVVAKSATNGHEIFCATSSKGDYSFYNVTPDTYRMGYTLTGYQTVHPGDVNSPVVGISHGHTAWVNVYLDPNHSRVYGRILDTNGQFPLVNARVLINGTGMQTLSDSTGYFSFAKVSGGNYTLNISHPQHQTVSNLAITVAASGDTNLGDIKVSFSAITLTGRLAPDNPGFLEAVNGFSTMGLRVLNYPTAQVSLTHDRTGFFTITAIPGNNSYRLFPSIPGYRLYDGSSEFVVQAGPFNTYVGDIRMSSLKNTLNGVVRTSDGKFARTGTVIIDELGMRAPIVGSGTYSFPYVQTGHELTLSFTAIRDPLNAYVVEILNNIKVRPFDHPIPFRISTVTTQANALIAFRDTLQLADRVSRVFESSPENRNLNRLHLIDQMQNTKRSLFQQVIKDEESIELIRNYWENGVQESRRQQFFPLWKKLMRLKKRIHLPHAKPHPIKSH